MQELTKAVLKAMQEIDNVEKLLDVGTGKGAYKGVSDKDVKQAVRKIMIENGLVILPTSVDPKTTVSEWDQEEEWNGVKSLKHKVQVLTEVTTKYLLSHTSGESIEVCGYGHGVDSQDKSAGKATTYALKNLLLYSFLIPTGNIDDADNTHSDDIPQRPANAKTYSDPRVQNATGGVIYASDAQVGAINRGIKEGKIGPEVAKEIPTMSKVRASEIISKMYGN
jgi:ERF superfamily